MLTRKFLLLVIAAIAAPNLVFASGTFTPPPIPKNFQEVPVEEKIRIGKALYNGKEAPNVAKLPGTHCAGCHSGADRLKRRQLRKISDRLKEVIEEEHEKRYGVKGDSQTIVSLYYYIYTRWRLDR